MDDLSTLVGEFILLFGSLEHALLCSIVSICMKHCPSNSPKYPEMLELLIKNNEFSVNLDYLKYFVSDFIKKEDRKDWEELIADINELMQMRNIIVHQMYGAENNTLIKRKTSRSLKRKAEYIEIQKEDLQKSFNLLTERYRQLFDSVIEVPFFAKVNKEITWISKYKQLKY